MIGKVVVLTTGGTIASRSDSCGVRTAQDNAAALIADTARPAGVTVEARDVLQVGSYLLTLPDMLGIVRRVHEAIETEDVSGVVVTHGTDTMEETAFLADLVHVDTRPVVFTGAQQAADASDSDGPHNLADAIAVAASPDARDHGALIVFAGGIYPAYGTRKVHTLATAAFATPDGAPLGRVTDGTVAISSTLSRPKPLDLATLDLSGVRVDIVSYYPGADTIALRGAADAGARGVVLEGTGAGNANPAFCAEIARLTASGVVVALSTRVAAGPVAALYGAGGGVDLLQAGAVPTGTLRAAQSRVLLAALLANLPDADRVRHELRGRIAV